MMRPGPKLTGKVHLVRLDEPHLTLCGRLEKKVWTEDVLYSATCCQVCAGLAPDCVRRSPGDTGTMPWEAVEETDE